MWADETNPWWTVFDIVRLVAACLLIYLALSDQSDGLLGWSLMALVLFGLYARLPWKRWFGYGKQGG